MFVVASHYSSSNVLNGHLMGQGWSLAFVNDIVICVAEKGQPLQATS